MFFIRIFYARVIAWLAGIDWAGFLRVVSTAVRASDAFPKPLTATEEQRAAANAGRVAMVNDFIAAAFPGLKGWVINVVRELAVAWLNRSYPTQ